MNNDNDNYTDDDAFVVEMMDGGWHWIGCDLLCPTVGQLVLTSLLMPLMMISMMMMTVIRMTMMRMTMMMDDDECEIRHAVRGRIS